MMCSIVGAIIWTASPTFEIKEVDRNLNDLMYTGHERGRDGRGYHLLDMEDYESYRSTERQYGWIRQEIVSDRFYRLMTFIGNMRAEPTTEFVAEKREYDQQPYTRLGWHMVHNGTIANDKDLRTKKLLTTIDSAAIVEQLEYETGFQSVSLDKAWEIFQRVIHKLKGSYAILVAHQNYPGVIFTAANYRPIWFSQTAETVYFSSMRQMPGVPEMIAPYTINMFKFDWNGELHTRQMPIRKTITKKRALVVCSGGLDSVVSACAARALGYEIHLIHFMYGSRAQGQEVQAMECVSEHLSAGLTFFPLPVYKTSDSPLLDANAKVAGGEEGAEFAHEWVPARNLLLLSVATAFAESNGYDTIVLGNNLEEAGAYPDNEPEFIAKFNDLLPFAVGDGKQIQVIMPVGNMMKHEIVAYGLDLKAPMHLTWSCYRNDVVHCGTCGPCYMRRKAFEINGAIDPIRYKGDF